MKDSLKVWDVLKSPVLTEKWSDLRDESLDDERGQILIFKVAKNATKNDIKGAVEEIFGVKVDKVRTTNYRGKLKRQGRFVGRRPSWKKAYVTLKVGEPQVDYAEAI